MLAQEAKIADSCVEDREEVTAGRDGIGADNLNKDDLIDIKDQEHVNKLEGREI